MDIVKPPFLLDFGKAYVDFPPDFTEEVLRDCEEQQRDIWEDRWPEVQSIVWQLEQDRNLLLGYKEGEHHAARQAACLKVRCAIAASNPPLQRFRKPVLNRS